MGKAATAERPSRSFSAQTADFEFDDTKVIDMMEGGGRPVEWVRESVANGVLALLGFEFAQVDVDGQPVTTSLEYEAFMAQGVVITVLDSKDPLAPPLVACGVNGDFRWLPRNKMVRIPRRFVEVLAHSVERSFKTVETNDPDSDNRMKTERKNTPSYPFAVVQDPAGEKGRRWLEMMFKQGTHGSGST